MTREVTTIRDFAEKATVDIAAEDKVWLTLREPGIPDTRDFTVTLANTRWQVNDMESDSPNPSGNGERVVYDKDLATGETTAHPLSSSSRRKYGDARNRLLKAGALHGTE
jgi:hypothetical protein